MNAPFGLPRDSSCSRPRGYVAGRVTSLGRRKLHLGTSSGAFSKTDLQKLRQTWKNYQKMLGREGFVEILKRSESSGGEMDDIEDAVFK